MIFISNICKCFHLKIRREFNDDFEIKINVWDCLLNVQRTALRLCVYIILLFVLILNHNNNHCATIKDTYTFDYIMLVLLAK